MPLVTSLLICISILFCLSRFHQFYPNFEPNKRTKRKKEKYEREKQRLNNSVPTLQGLVERKETFIIFLHNCKSFSFRLTHYCQYILHMQSIKYLIERNHENCGCFRFSLSFFFVFFASFLSFQLSFLLSFLKMNKRTEGERELRLTPILEEEYNMQISYCGLVKLHQRQKQQDYWFSH